MIDHGNYITPLQSTRFKKNVCKLPWNLAKCSKTLNVISHQSYNARTRVCSDCCKKMQESMRGLSYM